MSKIVKRILEIQNTILESKKPAGNLELISEQFDLLNSLEEENFEDCIEVRKVLCQMNEDYQKSSII